MSAADLLREEINRQRLSANPVAPPEGAVADDAMQAAFDRRFSDSDRRKARATGQLPQVPDEAEDEYTRAKRILFPEKPAEPTPMPLNGSRPVNALADAMRGPGSTVRTPDTR